MMSYNKCNLYEHDGGSNTEYAEDVFVWNQVVKVSPVCLVSFDRPSLAVAGVAVSRVRLPRRAAPPHAAHEGHGPQVDLRRQQVP